MTPKPKDIAAWIAAEMERPFLPALLDELRERVEGLKARALKFGNTDREKAQVLELEWVIDLIERYGEYSADTETETGEA